LAEAKKIQPAASPKKKRVFFSYLVLFTSAFLLFIILLVSLTQTSVFKNWLKNYGTDKFNEIFGEKGAVLSVGSIEGNFFSEIIINNALLKIKNDDAAKFDKVKITFDIFKLIDNEANLTEVTLINPSVNFVKIITPKGDTVWNIPYVFASDEKKKGETSEFNWKINVKRLKIENLNFVMLGKRNGEIPIQALQIMNEKNLNTENLKISSFNIETRLQYDKNAAQLWISHLGFNSNFGFDLKGLSGDFYISESRAEINKLNIESSRSWIQMEYVFLDKLNLMKVEGLPSFKDKDLRLSMVAKNFDFDDLKAFLPAVDFLDKDVYLELKCKGKFDDILIEKCALKTVNSNLNFSGRMVNLVEPEHLWFDVTANDITLDPEDTKIYIPGLPVQDYSHVGSLKGSLTYKGEPLDFYTTFDVSTSFGSAKGYYSMNLKNSTIAYETSVETKNINVGKLLKDPKLETDITGKIDVNGRGFDLASINTNVKYDIVDSKLFEQKIDKSSGVINLRGYNIDADVNYVSGKLAAEVKGEVNIRDMKNPSYNLKGRVANLDIAQFTKNDEDKSDLSFAFDVNGKGYSPENIEGNYNIKLENSYYGKYDFPATPIDLKISTGGQNDVISITSNLVDFKAQGSFSIVQIGEVIVSNLAMIQNEISKKFNLDTLLPVRNADLVTSNMDFVYEMKTKNSEAITKMFYLNDLDFAGDIKGYIKNSSAGFDGKSIINIQRFSYRDSVFALKNARAELTQQNDYAAYSNNPKGSFNSFTSSIIFRADKLQLSSSRFDSVGAKMNLSDGVQGINVYGKKDSTINANIAGSIDLLQDSVYIDFQTINFYYNKIYVKNSDSIHIVYNPADKERTLIFQKFTLESKLANVDLSGKYSISGNSDFTAELTNLDFPTLTQYSYDPQSVYAENESQKFKTPVKGKIRRVSMYFKGTMEDPTLGLEMNTGIIRYKQIKVGRVDAFIDFANKNLSTDVLVSNAQGQGSLRLTGNIPFSNPMTTPDSASYADVLTKPLDLELKAKNFQINFFSKLIPNFSEIRGFLNGDLFAKGTVSEPVLTGNANIEKGRFFFSWNGLYYRFETSLKAENSDLIVEQFKVFNDVGKIRFMNIWGKINFAGLGINEIDLSTSGDMYFLDGSSIQNRFGFSGEMLAGIGNPPIRIKGPLNNLLVSGQLMIKSAKLYFPSIQGLAYDINTDDFAYRIITDEKTKKYLDTVIVVSDELENIDPFLRYNYQITKREPSVADFITYDLEIVTEKNIYVNMIMNPLTREELFGEIQGNLKLDNKTPDKRFQLFGDMNIVGDSYYRFYKNFKIKDSRMSFRGDYMNPEINLTAEYKNTSYNKDNNTEITFVVLEIKGTRNKPVLTLRLKKEDDTYDTGENVQQEAISLLLFGQKNISANKELLENTASNVAGNFVSSLLYSAIRDVAPFILNTEVIYNGGDIGAADIRVTSGFGDAIVKVGGKILSNINNFEFSIEYPLNKLFKVNLSNNLLLEISRESPNSNLNYDQGYVSSVGITYKIRY